MSWPVTPNPVARPRPGRWNGSTKPCKSRIWPDLQTAQAAVDAFRVEYNTNRPHQALDMAFPADRFIPAPAGPGMALRLPNGLHTDPDQDHNERRSALAVASRPAAAAIAPPEREAARSSRAGVGIPSTATATAVEVSRVVPASGNLTVCGQQFWLGPDRAGTPVTLWADSTVVHLIVNGVRLKTVPSRLTAAHLHWLLTDGGRPAGPPPPVNPNRTRRSRWTGWSTPPAPSLSPGGNARWVTTSPAAEPPSASTGACCNRSHDSGDRLVSGPGRHSPPSVGGVERGGAA